MQELMRWWAGWQGIQVEPGADLTLEFAAWREGGFGLLVLTGVVLAIALVFRVYRSDGASLAAGQRTLLASLRAAAILLAVLVLLEPQLVTVKREERPGRAILLVDVSQSMEQRDAFRREEVRDLADAWRELGREPDQSTRLELARALLEHEDGRLLADLAAKNDVVAYTFDLEAEAFSTGSAVDWSALRAEGRFTNPGGAVRTALENSREASVAAVVLLTDGRRNAGLRGAEVARLLEQRKVPRTLVLGIGDPSETQSIDLERVEAPEKVFQRDPFALTVQLSSRGYDSTEALVTVYREVVEGVPGEQVASQRVQIGGDVTQASVEFGDLTADEAGIEVFRVEVQPPDGTPVVTERHTAHTQVEVLGEQTRVLLIAGGPSHEYRILRNTLTRDKTIELRCWLTSADPSFPQDGNVSITELPTDRASLDEIDVVILVDPDSSRLGREFCELVAQHVVDAGAGLWWVCGEKYTLDALREQASTRPLADLLPVVPDLVRADRRVIGFGHAFARPWPYELTPEGRESKVVRLVDQKDANALLWPRLPGHHFAFPVLRAKPLATPLVRMTNPELATSEGDAPIVAQQFVGAGRVLFSATDETYRWRSAFEDAYNRFWVKGIRMLFEGRLNSGSSRLSIRTDEDSVALGESVLVTAQARDESFQPLAADSIELELVRRGGVAQPLELEARSGEDGVYAISLRPQQPGFYTVSAPGDGGDGAPFATASFQVVPAAVERRGPVDLAELTAVASAPDGELLRTPQELFEALPDIPSMRTAEVFRTPHAVWDTWLTIVAILALLATEWWLRKWFNLL